MILVTGGTGLLGMHVLYDLTSQGKSVRATKRSSSNLKIVEEVFQYYSPEKYADFLSKIEWVEADITDVFDVENIMNDIEEVYHCAALVSFHASDYDKLLEINAEGTANLVNVALENNVRKFCHVSSTAATGKVLGKELITESTPWKSSKELSGYSISKYSGENEVWRASEEGMEVVIVNPSVIVSPGNWENSSASTFKAIHKGLKFYPEGANAFVDVRDVSRAMITLMASDIKNERFILIGENLSFKTFFEIVAKHLNKDAPNIKASKLLTEIAWRAMAFTGYITGKKPLITKETSRAGQNIVAWSNEKIKQALDFEFTSVDSAVENAAGFFNSYSSTAK